MFNSDRHRITKCNIGVRDISDHAGVYLTLHLDSRRKDKLWRLNTNLLNDPQCQKYVKGEFQEYMTHNDDGAVSPSVLWDAAKAVIRGKHVVSSEEKGERETN